MILSRGTFTDVETYEHGMSEMTITTLSARDFNQDVDRAKRATINGPVIITDRGKPTHALMNKGFKAARR